MRLTHIEGCVLAALLCCYQAAPAAPEQRFALLIGNQTYRDNVGPLVNPHNDVDLVRQSLERLNFRVTTVRDAGFSELIKSVNKHISQIQEDDPSSISFIYYSGHGASDSESGLNYLIPVDVEDADTSTLWDNSVALKGEMLDKLSQNAPDATHYVVVDACRTELRLRSKGTRAFEVDGRGFVPIPRSANLVVAYSTSPGSTASDIGDGSSPYARALAEELLKPGLEVFQMFRNVQRRVKQSTGQVPWLDVPPLPMRDVYLAGTLPGSSGASVAIEQTSQPERVAFELERASLQRNLPALFAQVGEEGVQSGGLFAPRWKWPKRSVEMCFLDGTPELNSRVASIARQWTLYGDIEFNFGDWENPRNCSTSGTPSDVRISYEAEGDWSFIGASSTRASLNVATLNLGTLRDVNLQDLDNGTFNKVILHEFGHALGFHHNWLAPSSGCDTQIDWDVVYRQLNTQGWSREQIDRNFRFLGESVFIGSFDRRSVMNYEMPAEFFKEGASSKCYPAPLNELSLRDKLSVYSIYGTR
jgi:hypothetical protein